MKTEHSKAFQLDLIETLPHKPYCTDELGVTYIRPKITAIKKKYLQVNQPKLVTYLIFDIDRQGAVLAWYDCNLPPP
ncbi:replication initiation protein, partial [Vibrio sp. 10N.261.46.A3]|uniref:replication initiation protein n=1 Tax=Vibrio sp. 10N.261.46.A3 TaxID=3229658 RepID=UPI00354D2497